jgi:hypothetical protein
VLSTWLYVQADFCFLTRKERKYNPICAKDEESVSDMLSEELDVDSDDEINLENEGQSTSEELSNASSESECESETSVVRIDGWEGVTMGNKKPTAYTFTKNALPQFNLLSDAEPMDYFRLFFNDELLNNIVIEVNRYARQNFGPAS